jgi:hypothetical protein
MESSKALLWINRWIRHMAQTKQHETRLEYRAREKFKIGREKRARLQNIVEEL